MKLKSLTYEIERDLKEADHVRKGFVTFLCDNEIPSDIVNYLELAIYEIIVNVIEHGDIKSNNSSIKIKSDLSEAEFTCCIRYSGSEYNINNHKMPDIVEHFKSGKDSGLGIYMIRSLMDKVEYWHEKGENWLKITKSIN